MNFLIQVRIFFSCCFIFTFFKTALRHFARGRAARVCELASKPGASIHARRRPPSDTPRRPPKRSPPMKGRNNFHSSFSHFPANAQPAAPAARIDACNSPSCPRAHSNLCSIDNIAPPTPTSPTTTTAVIGLPNCLQSVSPGNSQAPRAPRATLPKG